VRASVAEAWPAVCRLYEGVTTWLYLDTKGKVTTGVGFLVDTVAGAQALPWLTSSNRAATKAEIETEWRRVKALVKWQHLNGLNAVWRDSAKLHLDLATVDRLLDEMTPGYWTGVVKSAPNVEQAPADAQLALLDLSWQNGGAFLNGWPDTRAAVRAADWADVARVIATFLPAKADRTARRVRLFRNAATVVRLGLDRDVLWDATTPTLTTPATPEPPVPAPTPQEPPVPTVKHSETWDVDYVLYGKGGGHSGGYVPVSTAAILDAVAKETGRPIYLSQGGLSGSVKASAKTHLGLGTFDIALDGRTKAQVWLLVSALLRCGIVAFPRGFTWDSFAGKTLGNLHDGNEHVHAVDANTLSSSHEQARDQVAEWKRGGDGLLGSARYTGPSTPLGSWKESPYNPANVVEGRGSMYVASGQLLGLDVDRVQREDKDRGERIYYRKIVTRWGRRNIVTVKGTYFAIGDASQQYLSETPVEVAA